MIDMIKWKCNIIFESKQNNTVDPNAEESLGQSEEGKAEEEERRAKLRLFRLENKLHILSFLSNTP